MPIRINAAVLLVAALLAVVGCQGQAVRPAAEAPPGGGMTPASAKVPADTAALRKEQVREADHLLEQGKTDDAIAVLRQVVTADPANLDAWNLLTVAFAKVQSAPAAVVAGRRAMQLAPENMTVRYNLGMALLANSQPEEALPLLEEAVASAPGPDTLYGLARAYQFMAGREPKPTEWLDRAMTVLDRMEKEYPEDARSRFLRPHVRPDLDADGEADQVTITGHELSVTDADGDALLAYEVPSFVLNPRWAVLDLGAPRPSLVLYWREPMPEAAVFDYSTAAGTLVKVGEVVGPSLTLGYEQRQISVCPAPCTQASAFGFSDGAWSWTQVSVKN